MSAKNPSVVVTDAYIVYFHSQTTDRQEVLKGVCTTGKGWQVHERTVILKVNSWVTSLKTIVTLG